MSIKWIIVSLMSIPSAYAMEQTHHNLVLQQVNHQKYLQITARNSGSHQPLGWINYMPVVNADKRWQIATLGVEKNYRNQGIASALFKSCFADLKEKKAAIVVWDCAPLEPGMSAETLAGMYEAMIQKHIMPQLPGTLTKRATPWGTIKMTYTINQASTTPFTA